MRRAPAGTMAHSYIEAFASVAERTFPDLPRCAMLDVDAMRPDADVPLPTGSLGPMTGSRCVVDVEAGSVRLPGDLEVPDRIRGLVVFAHGSGSSRRSPRNAWVAERLRDEGFGTLLFDLLTNPEERDRRNVFDVGLLASRLTAATRWLAGRPEAAGLSMGFFGASTGAAAALVAAADAGTNVGAVVSRGGRPDLAGDRLPDVVAPTLLIVGGRDGVVLDLNREARSRLTAPSELAVVPGATHLFEEPGALEVVAGLAAGWFERHLRQRRSGH
jgi:putative phosphoribosyl transferase